jgi:hypothetical protein
MGFSDALWSPHRDDLCACYILVLTLFVCLFSRAAAMGFTYGATQSIVANQREKDDAVNSLVGGCAAGFLVGLKRALMLDLPVAFCLRAPTEHSLPGAFATCALFGTAAGTFDYAGRALVGDQSLSYEERRKRFFKQQPSALPLEADK